MDLRLATEFKISCLSDAINRAKVHLSRLEEELRVRKETRKSINVFRYQRSRLPVSSHLRGIVNEETVRCRNKEKIEKLEEVCDVYRKYIKVRSTEMSKLHRISRSWREC